MDSGSTKTAAVSKHFWEDDTFRTVDLFSHLKKSESKINYCFSKNKLHKLGFTVGCLR